MNCSSCASEMSSMTLASRMSSPVTFDVCVHCQAFWFDKYESLQLSPGSTLKLMKFIGEQTASAPKASISAMLHCPRCSIPLRFTHDLQHNTRFTYWRCGNDHGRFITFFDFLREKNFIRELSPQQIAELRQTIQTINCSNCGAAVDLAARSVCEHCGTPVSMLDLKQPEQMIEALKKADEPHPVDPALPFDLMRAKHDIEASFAHHDSDWWRDASSSGLVQAGLNAVARWLSKS